MTRRTPQTGPGKRTAPAMVAPLAAGYGLETGQFSDPGCVRKRNEDSIALLRPAPGLTSEESLLAIVADGMGIPVDLRQALAWVKRAKANGYEKADKELQLLQ